MSSKPLVLVTGAAGYVAEHCIYLLLKEGYPVRATLRNLEDSEKIKHVRSICEEADSDKLQLVAADLVGEQSEWDEAVKDCEWIFHVASPLKFGVKDVEKELYEPAVKGTTMVMKAAAKTPSVRKLIYTGAGFSCQKMEGNLIEFDAEIWGDVEKNPNLREDINAYAGSKIKAEKAAFDIWKNLTDEENKFDFVSLLPCFILGPILDTNLRSSPHFVTLLLQKEIPMLQNVKMSCCDVRDVARAHIAAATTPSAVGKRILICTEAVAMKTLAGYLASEFEPQGYQIPSFVAPNFLIKLMSYFVPDLVTFSQSLGKEMVVKNAPMKEILGIEGRSAKESVISTAYSVVEKGLCKKTEKYVVNKEFYA